MGLRVRYRLICISAIISCLTAGRLLSAQDQRAALLAIDRAAAKISSDSGLPLGLGKYFEGPVCCCGRVRRS